MEALTFFSAMNRGQFREEQGIEGSSYCIFFAPMEELVTRAGGIIAGRMAVLAEGDAKDRTDIIYLEPLPLFFK